MDSKQIVKKFPKYLVSKKGEVFNKMTSRKLKLSNDTDGYKVVTLYGDSHRKTVKVHRLVAEAFISNPENKPEVNHKNANRQDNRVENLEWATCKENQRYKYDVIGYRPGASKLRRRVECIETGKIYESQTEAAINAGISQGAVSSSITRGCRGGIYHWRLA